MMSYFVITEQSLPKTRQEAYEFANNEDLDHFTKQIWEYIGVPKDNNANFRFLLQRKPGLKIVIFHQKKSLGFFLGSFTEESYERICVGVSGSEKSYEVLSGDGYQCFYFSLPKIGGSGIIVQIDESKFGKSKYNRGRVMEGHWVLGMIAQNSEDLRLVVCPQNKRDAATLIEIIKNHVTVGCIIHTDDWKAYSGLSNYGYIHHTVNHSVEFVADDGTHTQRIESQWNAAKRSAYS